MSACISQVRRFVTLLAVAAGLFLATARAPAEPVKDKQDPLVARVVCELLKRGHLSHPEFGDEVSRRLFRHFLKDLDPTKLYFLQSDVDEFKKHETDLDDQLLQGDLSFPYKVYERFVQRFGQRMKLIEELVNAHHDFTAKESLDTDYDKMSWART